MTVKMMAVDMDGTFLDKESSYNHQEFFKIYQKLKKQNIHFVVASGNPLKQLQNQFPDIKDELTYIAENGGYIVDQGEELALMSINQSDCQIIIDALKKMDDVLCWVCTKNQSYTLTSLSKHYYEMFLPYFPGVKQIDDFSLINEPILKFALYLPHQNVNERIDDFVQLVSQNVHVVDSGHDCVDIISSHVHKGNALTILMEKYHLSPNEIMAFGDANNDLEMLKKFTYGYAMENAKEEFKKQFSYIAPANNHQGVLKVIDYYLENQQFFNLKKNNKKSH